VIEVPDRTGRFKTRPHFEPGELDRECDAIISDFMQKVAGRSVFPVPTDIITKLIERDAADLDLGADLSREGSEVEGLTRFFFNGKPKVLISRALTESPQRQHRLRTTLTHEYGHVRFHAYLWQVDESSLHLPGFGPTTPRELPKCLRQNIVSAAPVDWMEWQAGYVCGALLMPIREMRDLVDSHLKRAGLSTAPVAGSPHAQALQQDVVKRFDVSMEAARVRLSVLGALSREANRPIFGN
jgi:hypothetical protein